MIAGSVQSELETYRQALDSAQREFVEHCLPGPEDFDRMIRYHLGWVDAEGQPIQAYAGKQLRPLLLLLSTEAAGGEWRRALPAAIAIELLHNFSLVHDDIEDNSPQRRGRPTLWTIWGAPNAINAGDLLFGLAHLSLWQLAAHGIDAETILRVAVVYEKMCLQLTRGQHLDMQFEQAASVSVEEYLDMIAGKSAALVSAAMHIGAILAGLADEQAAAYAAFGRYLGLAFQIQDDILGIWGDPAITGKSAATDIQSKKKSLPVLYGLKHDPGLATLYASELDQAGVTQVVSRLEAAGAHEYARALSAQYFEDIRAIGDTLVSARPASLQRLLALAFSLLNRSA